MTGFTVCNFISFSFFFFFFLHNCKARAGGKTSWTKVNHLNQLRRQPSPRLFSPGEGRQWRAVSDSEEGAVCSLGRDSVSTRPKRCWHHPLVPVLLTNKNKKKKEKEKRKKGEKKKRQTSEFSLKRPFIRCQASPFPTPCLCCKVQYICLSCF